MRLLRFRKVWIWTFGWLVHQINSLYKALKLKQNYGKNKVVAGRNSVLHFVLPFRFLLTLASDRAVLYGNVTFPILVLSAKRLYSSFLEKVCVFQKICFKVEVLQTLKHFRWKLSHKNMPISQTQGCFKNLFRPPQGLSYWGGNIF